MAIAMYTSKSDIDQAISLPLRMIVMNNNIVPFSSPLVQLSCGHRNRPYLQRAWHLGAGSWASSGYRSHPCHCRGPPCAACPLSCCPRCKAHRAQWAGQSSTTLLVPVGNKKVSDQRIILQVLIIKKSWLQNHPGCSICCDAYYNDKIAWSNRDYA